MGLDGRHGAGRGHRLGVAGGRLVPGGLDGTIRGSIPATTDIGGRQEMVFGHHVLGATEAGGHRLAVVCSGSALRHGGSCRRIAESAAAETGTPGQCNGGGHQANHRNGTFGRPTGYADTHQLTRTQVLNTSLRLGR
ncbi:hypothetical protein D3C72_1925220 [compost metagenome]